jgi:transcriptional regulator with XRE-family HTH domain
MSAPALPRKLAIGERIRWARKHAGLSHDRLIEKLGRSNRSHLIKIERGLHVPRSDLRDAIADATGVPREFLGDDEDEESDPVASLMGALRRVVRDEVLRQARQ